MQIKDTHAYVDANIQTLVKHIYLYLEYWI